MGRYHFGVDLFVLCLGYFIFSYCYVYISILWLCIASRKWGVTRFELGYFLFSIAMRNSTSNHYKCCGACLSTQWLYLRKYFGPDKKGPFDVTRGTIYFYLFNCLFLVFHSSKLKINRFIEIVCSSNFSSQTKVNLPPSAFAPQVNLIL